MLMAVRPVVGALSHNNAQLDLVVPSFDLEGAPLESVADKLGDLGLLVGIEVREKDGQTFTLHLKQSTIRAILDAVAGQLPGYSWSEYMRSGPHFDVVYNLAADAAREDPLDPLNAALGALALQNADPIRLIKHVQYQVPSLLSRVKFRGGAESFITPIPPPNITVSVNVAATGGTVADLLNELAISSRSSWICRPGRLSTGQFCEVH